MAIIGRTPFYPFMRDFQSRFGFLLDGKAAAQRLYRNIRKHPFEKEFGLISELPANSGCYLDIGANRGQSIEAIRLFRNDAEIHAFEPNGILVEKLSRRYASLPNVTLHDFGLSNENLSSNLYIPYYRSFMFDGLASFDKSEAEDWLNEETVWHFRKSLLSIREVPCNLRVLDELNLSPVFMKIDVQGNERSVLEGGIDTLKRATPLIILEKNPNAHNLLTELGWQRYAYNDGRLVPGGESENNDVYLSGDNPLHVEITRRLK